MKNYKYFTVHTSVFHRPMQLIYDFYKTNYSNHSIQHVMEQSLVACSMVATEYYYDADSDDRVYEITEALNFDSIGFSPDAVYDIARLLHYIYIDIFGGEDLTKLDIQFYGVIGHIITIRYHRQLLLPKPLVLT